MRASEKSSVTVGPCPRCGSRIRFSWITEGELDQTGEPNYIVSKPYCSKSDCPLSMRDELTQDEVVLLEEQFSRTD